MHCLFLIGSFNSNDKDVTRQDVVDQLNLLDYEYFFKTVDAILKEDEAETLLTFDEVLKNGFEGDHFINGLGEHLRNLLMCKDALTHPLLQVSESLKERYINQANLFKSSAILTSLEIINKSDLSYPRAKNKRLHIELSLLKLCFLGRLKRTPTVTTEKKSPELKTVTNKQVKNDAPVVEPVQAITNKTPTVDTGNKKSENIASVQKSTPKAVSSPSSKISSRVVDDTTMQNTPSIGSIDSILSEITEASEKITEQKETISIEGVEEVYNAYLKNVSSPSLANAMTKTIKSLDQNTLTINVPNQMGKDLLIQETALIQKIRDEFNVQDLELNVVIKKSLFPESDADKPRKYLSEKEKFELLNKTNPLLKEMIDRFDLKIDN